MAAAAVSTVVDGLLWYKIVSGAVVATIAGLIALYLQFFFRRGWVSDPRRIESISCREETTRTCRRPCRDCDITCTSRPLHQCVVTVDGSTARIEKAYDDAPPKAGAMATVYYDPKDPNETMTLDPARVGVAVLFFAFVALASGGYSYFLYAYRHNDVVRGYNAVSTLLNGINGSPLELASR